jgi:hypothetical protein
MNEKAVIDAISRATSLLECAVFILIWGLILLIVHKPLHRVFQRFYDMSEDSAAKFYWKYQVKYAIPGLRFGGPLCILLAILLMIFALRALYPIAHQ